MIKNFFFLAFRNYLKNKVFVIINVLGLGIAMACCIVAYLNYQFEADFNTMHVNHESIYKINISRTINDRLVNYCPTPVSLAPAIEKEIAGIDRVVRYNRNQMSIKYNGGNDAKIFDEDIGFADKDFLKMFTFPMKYGDQTSFEDPNKILLSETASNKLFGDTNPIGESVSLFDQQGKETILTVGGVFNDIPLNSIIQRVDAFAAYSKYLTIYNINEFDWKPFTSGTFLQVSDPALISGIEQSLSRYKEIQNKNRDDWKIEKYSIQSLHQFTKDSYNLSANRIGNNLIPAAIYTPIVMALLLILLACFNFINTAIASSNKRLKEIGVRKVSGGSRASLVLQFLGENFIICVLALIVALMLGVYLTGEYSKLLTIVSLSANYFSNPGIWLFLGVVLLLTTLFSAFYPAMYISSFSPVQVLKGTVKFSGNGVVSRTLLVLQFSISLIALISGIVAVQNGKYQEGFDYGYNRNQTIIVPGGSYTNAKMLHDKLKSNPSVLQMALTDGHPEFGGMRKTVTYIDKKAEVQLYNSYTNYCSVAEIKITKGREFTPEFESSDINRSAIITESLVKEFGFDDPIGKTIKMDTLELTVIGVANDVYIDIQNPLIPAVIQMVPKEQLSMLIVKGKQDNLIALNQQIKKDWQSLIPNSIYPGNLSGQFFDGTSLINRSLRKIYGFLSIVSIFLSVMALYTLVTQTIIKRTKEIGIRKVMGSSSFLINLLIGRSFYLMLLIAAFFGGVGGYFMNQILLGSMFSYHTPITIISVLIPVIIVFLLAFVTLTSKVYHTLSKNPINSLRDE